MSFHGAFFSVNIDKLGVTEYNVNKISVYASRQYTTDRYNEVKADYVMLRRREWFYEVV